ncbi:MAG: acetyltransferase [Pseudomonadota bacterium]|nr:acetyltransferase [Pseudomonadota bacterium]
MAFYDVFNGDADGICALQQLRLAEPREATLVTGVKRDIALLGRVEAASGDEVTALDISLDKNRDALLDLLSRGARVRYFDHHYPGEIPLHVDLDVHIETLPDKGTSLLVDDYLHGEHRAWALVGTFGDNFDAAARRAAAPLGLEEPQLAALRELGIYLNYNGYGARITDLHFPPDELFRRLHPYVNPLDFIAEDHTFAALRRGYADDMAKASAARPEIETVRYGLYILPAKAWARRVSGVLANDLARATPDRAHALLTRLPEGGFLVSVRAPLATGEGADDLCRQFPSGGGRKAAGGINNLPEDAYGEFVERFAAAF